MVTPWGCPDDWPGERAAEPETLVLRVRLVSCERVWRRVRVPARMPLAEFHDTVLGPAVGWARGCKSYWFEDRARGTVYGPVGTGGGLLALDARDAAPARVQSDASVPLQSLLRTVGDVAHYIYDLEHRFDHELVVLRASSNRPRGAEVELLAGATACPPEDGLGLDGKGAQAYARLLSAVERGDAKDRIRRATRALNYGHDFLGNPYAFRPLEFDVKRHRKLIAAIVDADKYRMPSCAVCSERLEQLSRCSRCKRVWYCSGNCQRKDWVRGHKDTCRKATT